MSWWVKLKLSALHNVYETKYGWYMLNTKIGQWGFKKMSLSAGALFNTAKSSTLIGEYIKIYWPDSSVKELKSLFGDGCIVEDNQDFLDLQEPVGPSTFISEAKSTTYTCLNDFFTRRFRDIDMMRPVTGIISSPAEGCLYTHINGNSLTVKGKQVEYFHLMSGLPNLEEKSLKDYNAIVVYLDPTNYHRIHCPIDGQITRIVHSGSYYQTVNPTILHEKQLQVYDDNVKTIFEILTQDSQRIYVIAVGAFLIGSIISTVNEMDIVIKGQQLGYFQFGGSTVIMLVPNQVKDNVTMPIKVRQSLDNLLLP
jgi:phosphatidylserine decarboxylase precursor